MKEITVKIVYGPGKVFENATDIVNHLQDIGGVIFSHDDPFEQRDKLKEEVRELEDTIESLVKKNKVLEKDSIALSWTQNPESMGR